MVEFVRFDLSVKMYFKVLSLIKALLLKNGILSVYGGLIKWITLPPTHFNLIQSDHRTNLYLIGLYSVISF
jgi:hypothetical protein